MPCGKGKIGNLIRGTLFMQFQFNFVTLSMHLQIAFVVQKLFTTFQNHKVIAIPQICEQFTKLSWTKFQRRFQVQY